MSPYSDPDHKVHNGFVVSQQLHHLDLLHDLRKYLLVDIHHTARRTRRRARGKSAIPHEPQVVDTLLRTKNRDHVLDNSVLGVKPAPAQVVLVDGSVAVVEVVLRIVDVRRFVGNAEGDLRWGWRPRVHVSV